MKLRRKASRLLASWGISLLLIVLAPAVLLGGELVNRRIRRRSRLTDGPVWAARRPVHRVLFNPVWIALTAPARWLLDHLRPFAGSRRGRGGNGGPPGAGVREPRRPLPDLPAAAMALPEPRE
jgi:hypothetical protein